MTFILRLKIIFDTNIENSVTFKLQIIERRRELFFKRKENCATVCINSRLHGNVIKTFM